MVWVFAIIGIYVAILLGIAWFSLHPMRTPIYISPGAMGTPQEEVEFAGPAGPLRGWWVPAEGSRTVAVFLHGYLMNRAEMTPTAVTLWRQGVSSLLLDFRAHGRSGGKKCTMGMEERKDVQAAVAYVRTRVPGAKVVLIGSSMGSAASAMACADAPGFVEALVLDSSYSRLPEAILGWWRFLGGRFLQLVLWPTAFISAPLAGFSPFRVDVADALRKAGPLPTLIIHGDQDDLALPQEAERNLAACQGPCRLIWMPGCRHSEGRWVLPKRYEEALLGFLQEHGFVVSPAPPAEAPFDTAS